MDRNFVLEVTGGGKISFVQMEGILREKSLCSKSQEQTKDTFSYKWKREESYGGGYLERQLLRLAEP